MDAYGYNPLLVGIAGDMKRGSPTGKVLNSSKQAISDRTILSYLHIMTYPDQNTDIFR